LRSDVYINLYYKLNVFLNNCMFLTLIFYIFFKKNKYLKIEDFNIKYITSLNNFADKNR